MPGISRLNPKATSFSAGNNVGPPPSKMNNPQQSAGSNQFGGMFHQQQSGNNSSNNSFMKQTPSQGGVGSGIGMSQFNSVPNSRQMHQQTQQSQQPQQQVYIFLFNR